MFEDTELQQIPEEQSQEDKLVFPLNVHESVTASGGLKAGEKKSLVLSFWLFFNAILVWFGLSWLRQVLPNHYVLVVIIAEVVLQLVVGSFILRFVLDESTVMRELTNADNSFAKYFGIYHEHLADVENTYPFDTIEFSDGSIGVYLQFLLGYNTDQRSSVTYESNKAVQELINKSNLPYKILFSNEKFSVSQAAESLRDVVNGIEDPNLFSAYRDVVQGLLDIANEQSNVLCATYILYARTTIQKEELKPLVENILSKFSLDESAYRQVSVLKYKDIVEFYRNYYKLDVLDMGLIRVHAAVRKGLSCNVKLLKVYGKSGKAYSTTDYSRLTKDILDADGLSQVN